MRALERELEHRPRVVCGDAASLLPRFGIVGLWWLSLRVYHPVNCFFGFFFGDIFFEFCLVATELSPCWGMQHHVTMVYLCATAYAFQVKRAVIFHWWQLSVVANKQDGDASKRLFLNL